MFRVCIMIPVLLLLFTSTFAWLPVIPYPDNNDRHFNPIDSTKTASGMVYIYRIKAGTSNMYLISSPEGMILIDAGWPGFEQRVVRLLNRLHRTDLRLIIITHGHFDHYGSAAAIRRLTGAVIAIHKLDEPFMAKGITPLGKKHGMGKLSSLLLPFGEFFLRPEPAFANIVFNESFNLIPYGLNGYVLHTPGHTYGSCTVLINNEYAFTGDLLCNAGGSIQSQRFFAFNWDVQAYSLILLKSIAPQRCFPGHGEKTIELNNFLNLVPLQVVK
ncbi:MAG TPA: MBL fold metallo-hydrolase [Chitinispirillaceae bacterium]|nr:MBL fold metallo-hydrolase [Chitinispirillaceae bacterium]